MTTPADFKLLLRDRTPQLQAEIRSEGAWVAIDLPLAEALKLLQADVSKAQDRIRVLSQSIDRMSAEIPKSGLAVVQRGLEAVVTEQGNDIAAQGSAITDVQASLPGKADGAALDALTVLVEQTGQDLLSVSQALTVLQSALPGKADASALSGLTTLVSETQEGLTALSEDLVTLQATLPGKADASAVDQLVVQAEETDQHLLAVSQSVETLKVDLPGKADAGALDALTTRVEQTETELVAASQDLTELQAELPGKAAATAVNALTTRVQETEAGLESLSQALIELQASLPEKADASALQALTVQVHQAEQNLHAVTQALTELQIEIPGKVEASALDRLIVQIDQSAQDIMGLTESLEAVAQSITTLELALPGKANVSALDALTVLVQQSQSDITVVSESITTLRAEIDNLEFDIEFDEDGVGGAGTLRIDRLTFQVSDADADQIDRVSGAGFGFVAGGGGTTENFTVQTLDRNGRVFTATLTPGGSYEWPTSGGITIQPSGFGTPITLATWQATPADIDMQGEWAVEAGIYIPALAQAQEILEARVSLAENVDGDTTLSTLSRWLVKLNAGELVGGIGLLNDGTNIDFIVTADRFALVPPGWTGALGPKKVPFGVFDGEVYINRASIQDGIIDTAAIGEAVIENLHVSDTAEIAFAKMEKGDIFELTIGGSRDGTSGSIRSADYEAQIAGFIIRQDGGVEFNTGVFRGITIHGADVQSDNYVQGEAGWRIARTGFAEFDAAAIRGTLSAEHIDSDVRNWARLTTGMANHPIFKDTHVTRSWTSAEGGTVEEFDAFAIGIHYGDQAIIEEWAVIVTRGTRAERAVPKATAAHDTQYLLRMSATGDRTLDIFFSGNDSTQIGILDVWGIRLPGAVPGGGLVAPPPVTVTETPIDLEIFMTGAITAGDSILSWYCTFEWADNDQFTGASRVYDAVEGTTHGVTAAQGIPEANRTGTVYVRARFTSEAEDQGSEGTWSSTVSFDFDGIPIPVGGIAQGGAIFAEATTDSYYATFQWKPGNSDFTSGATTVYDTSLGTTHGVPAGTIPPASRSGVVYGRAQFTTEANGGGDVGEWSGAFSRNFGTAITEAPVCDISPNGGIFAETTSNSYYCTFQWKRGDSNFGSGATTTYDHGFGTTHGVSPSNGIPPESRVGVVYARARFSSQINDGGNAGPWSNTASHDYGSGAGAGGEGAAALSVSISGWTITIEGIEGTATLAIRDANGDLSLSFADVSGPTYTYTFPSDDSTRSYWSGRTLAVTATHGDQTGTGTGTLPVHS